MALNYTQLFTLTGKLTKYLNSYKSIADTTYPADREAIAAVFDTAALERLVEGIQATYLGWSDGITSQRATLAGFIQNVLADPVNVLPEIGVISQDLNAILPALWNQMIADGETINRSTVTVGTVTANAANQGNGTILTTKVLDGFNSPTQGALANLGYNGVDSELAVTSETMLWTCTADSMVGTSEGGEQFSVQGGINYGPLSWRGEGSGLGPTIQVGNADGVNLLTDGSFENWSSNSPSSWTIDAGTAGVNVFQETGASEVYRGGSSAKILGDGATVTIQLSQAVSPSALRARRMYNVSLRIKTSGIPASGSIIVQFAGTGYSPASSEKITIAAGSFPSTWTLYNFWISTPAVIPSDWKLTLATTGTLSSAAAVWMDSVAYRPATYHGGIGSVPVAGSSRFVVGDKFTSAISNDNAGVFQRLFREWFKVQLPSSGSSSIADSLAT